MWLGTIACRRLKVLMFRRLPKPSRRSSTGRATQNQGMAEKTTVNSPIADRQPMTTKLKENRWRSHPARSEKMIAPTLPAAKKRPSSKLLTCKRSFA